MQKYIRALFLLFVLAIIADVFSDSNGPSGGYTGAPSEGNCTTCHATYSLQTSGTKYDKIKLESDFTGNGYIPDSTYLIKISYKETGKTRYGFQLTALDVATNSAAGTFATNDSRTQTGTITVSAKTRYFIEHTKTGTATVATDSTAWFIKWKAPNKQVGKVRFYLNFNVADGNGNDNNDYIYKKSWDLDPSTLLPVANVKIKDTILCSGKSLQFLGSGTQSPTSYSWSFPSGSITVSNNQNPVVTYAASGNYFAVLTVKNAKGTSLPDTFRFKVLAGAVKPTLTVPTAVSLCTGDSTKLSVNAITGHTISWFPADNKKASIFVKDSGLYYAMSTNSVGCTKNSDNVKVSLLRKPAGTIFSRNKDSVFCLNTTPLFGVKNKFAPIIDSISPVSNKSGFVYDTSFTQSMISAGTKTVSAWLKSKDGCVSNEMKLNVQVLDSVIAPIVKLMDAQYTSLTFAWNKNKNTSYEYSTDAGKTWVLTKNSGADTSVIISTPTGNYVVNFMVRGIVLDRCGKTKVGSLSAKSKACVPINYSVKAIAKSVSCKDSILNLTLSAPGVANYKWAIGKDTLSNKNTYQWKLGANNNVIALGLMDMSASICGYSEKTMNWLAEQVPEYKIYFASDSVFCRSNQDEQFSVALRFKSPGKKNSVIGFYDTISWNYKDSLVVLWPKASVKHPGIFVNSVSDSGCAAKILVTNLVVKQPPTIVLTQNNLGNYQYSWSLKDVGAAGYTWTIEGVNYGGREIGPFDYYSYRGKYVHVIANVNDVGDGCYSTVKDSFLIDLLGINHLSTPLGAVAYPNPLHQGEKLVVMMDSKQSDAIYSIRLNDITGKEILSTQLPSINGKFELPTSGLSVGVYDLRITKKLNGAFDHSSSYSIKLSVLE